MCDKKKKVLKIINIVIITSYNLCVKFPTKREKTLKYAL